MIKASCLANCAARQRNLSPGHIDAHTGNTRYSSRSSKREDNLLDINFLLTAGWDVTDSLNTEVSHPEA